MLPSIPPNSMSLSALQRLGLADEGADASLSPSVVAAALGGRMSSSIATLQMQQQLALRRSILEQEVEQRSAQVDLISALLGRDALREALLARHQTYSNPFALAHHVQQEAIMNEAYQRGREEAMLSLLRSGTANPSVLKLASATRSEVERVAQPAALRAVASAPVSSQECEVKPPKEKAAYFDASTLEDPDEATIANRRTRGGVTEPFPEKLHRLLKDCEERGESDVISFCPHGRAFTVHHVERFCREVMPRYFKQSRLTSFQRQLNLYGFKRIASGADACGYYHELFLKGRPALAIYMRRVGIPKSGGGPSRTPNRTQHCATPDFYSMPPVNGNDDDTQSKKSSR